MTEDLPSRQAHQCFDNLNIFCLSLAVQNYNYKYLASYSLNIHLINLVQFIYFSLAFLVPQGAGLLIYAIIYSPFDFGSHEGLYKG